MRLTNKYDKRGNYQHANHPGQRSGSTVLQYAHYKYECSFILTILEVVVSIWWVAISIDMTKVAAKSSSNTLFFFLPSPQHRIVLWISARMSGRRHLKWED